MTMLDRVSGGAAGGRAPKWLATHPSLANHREHIAELIKATKSTNGSAIVISRESYLRQLDGMVFGQNPREESFKGTIFFQPDLKFRFDLPAGWKTANQKKAVRR